MVVDFDPGGGTGETRVTIQGGDGLEYCALASPGDALTWNDFSVECWEGGLQSPVFAVGSEITAVGVLLNSNDGSQVFTDFCLTDVYLF